MVRVHLCSLQALLGINVDLLMCNIYPCSARHLARASWGLRAESSSVPSPVAAVPAWRHRPLVTLATRHHQSHKDNYLRSQSLAMTRSAGATRCRPGEQREQTTVTQSGKCEEKGVHTAQWALSCTQKLSKLHPAVTFPVKQKIQNLKW